MAFHRVSLPSSAEHLVGVLAELESQGYVVLPELVPEQELLTIKEQLSPYLRGERFGRNDFEGHRSERIYALLAKAPAVASLVEHPTVLHILDALLMPNYLLSANLAINVHPGETHQQFHFDDGFCHLPRPRPPLGWSAIWAVDEFNLDNGATEIIPGSHVWDDQVPTERHSDIQKITMSPGSVLIFSGTLWHRGGANQGKATRLAITPQYCQPWVRPIETMTLAVPPRLATRFSSRVQALLGYSIHPPFMGYVDGMHPRRLIDQLDIR